MYLYMRMHFLLKYCIYVYSYGGMDRQIGRLIDRWNFYEFLVRFAFVVSSWAVLRLFWLFHVNVMS